MTRTAFSSFSKRIRSQMTISELAPGDIVKFGFDGGFWMFTGKHPYGGVVSRYLMVRVDVWPLQVQDLDEDETVESRHEYHFSSGPMLGSLLMALRIFLPGQEACAICHQLGTDHALVDREDLFSGSVKVCQECIRDNRHEE